MKIMSRKLLFVAALFAALLSTANAQTRGGQSPLTFGGQSWLGSSTDLSTALFETPSSVAADYLVTIYIDMSTDTTGGVDTDQTCVQLLWNDGYGNQPAVASNNAGCAVEMGYGARATPSIVNIPIHAAAGTLVGINTDGSVAGWVAAPLIPGTPPHTYNLIITATQLNP
jgi:hypothetical protein